ncbi:Natural resistance-associated macrophage domain containing protein [Amanita muscaria]
MTLFIFESSADNRHAPLGWMCHITGLDERHEETWEEGMKSSRRGSLIGADEDGLPRAYLRLNGYQRRKTVYSHARKHTGVGLICSVAYFDPGTWGVDIQAGSESGYRLLFVILLSGIFAVFLQVLAGRLGCVTGLDLATHYRSIRDSSLYRWGIFYPLYLLSEVAIIATDLSEMLGSAIALVLLFPRLELWHGVIITAANIHCAVPVRMFELLIAVLVFVVLICVAIIISKINVNWSDAFLGFVPSKFKVHFQVRCFVHMFVFFFSVGIIGGTIMPHSLFLGSALATQDRISHRVEQKDDDTEVYTSSTTNSPGRYCSGLLPCLVNYVKTSFLYAVRAPDADKAFTTAKRHSEHENNHLGFVLAHVYHGIADIVISLLGIAVVINALYVQQALCVHINLIMAGAVFYYGSDMTGGPASLFDTYSLIGQFMGKGAATIFAIALLASGQSSSLIATVAGQAVAEGFLRWRLSPVLRRLLTRLIAIVPSMTVAIVMGREGINTLSSQVVLSMALPFITLPLIYLTSSKKIMSVRKPRQETASNLSMQEGTLPVSSTIVGRTGDTDQEFGNAVDEWVDFSNSKITMMVGMLIWLLIVAANLYVLVNL